MRLSTARLPNPPTRSTTCAGAPPQMLPRNLTCFRKSAVCASERENARANVRMPGKSADRSARRARLIELIKTRSFQEGPEFKLASGKTSTFYFNMKPTMLDSEGSYLVASLILDQLQGVDADLIGGLEMGAVPIASSVAAVAFTQGRKLPAFFVRKQAKEHGTQSLVEGLAK